MRSRTGCGAKPVAQDNAFNALADERWARARIRATGKTVAWDAAKAYLTDRARGERPQRCGRNTQRLHRAAQSLRHEH